MGGGTSFSLNPKLDREQLAAAFLENRRLQIADFLRTGQAEVLRKALLARQDWALILNTSDRVFDIPRAAFDQLSPDQQAELNRLAIEAARDGFHYRYEAIRVPDEEAGRDGDLLSDFVRFMASEQTADFFRTITGIRDIAFADGQATAYSTGHFLTAHTDDVEGKQRRAAYVLGLSPVWRPEWGGLLMFHNANGDIEEAFTPRMGALRLFEVPVRHSVSYVNPIAPEPRLSVTGWLRGAARADAQSSE
jgi:SM-20-related protein